MAWMRRLFGELSNGRYPRLVDLPTGAGKTELVIVWLLALAWYGLNRYEHETLPRRLVWVVNRRVLVQQVSVLAKELLGKLASVGLEEVRKGLARISGDDSECFHVIELRGQIFLDTDWAIRPSAPQLLIGTVDQIGSRLLFQGYGLGKWGRPQQAGLLGVDCWVAVDEAHLVPAFVLTLRQLHRRCASDTQDLPAPFGAIFARLPFWLTELSATPGLPRPSEEQPFHLTVEEKSDPAISDRVLAARTRQVHVKLLPNADKPKEALIKALVNAAIASHAPRVAVFVREAGVADKVYGGIKSELDKPGPKEDRICKITGRIRGYERDRLAEYKAFARFLMERMDTTAESGEDPHFLIGTAAAEVGLDADADIVICDFASLPTLVQRLGRLDRRGV